MPGGTVRVDVAVTEVGVHDDEVVAPTLTGKAPDDAGVVARGVRQPGLVEVRHLRRRLEGPDMVLLP
jgi:hypothetical protein